MLQPNRFKAKGKPDPILPITLTPQEIATMEKLWITHAQNDLVIQKDFDALSVNLAYSSMTRDCGDVAAGYRMPTFLLQPSIQSCSPESTP